MKTLTRALLLLALVTTSACGSDPSDDRGTLVIEAHVEPDPPRVGRNTLHLQVRDGDGAPVEGASLTVEPFMPAHGHGSTEEPVVEELGAGAYSVAPVTITMPGAWTVNIRAEAAGETGTLVLEWNVK